MKKLLTLFAFALVVFTANAQSCPDKNHPHMIDLGLPSGTKWACCNVGANTPEGYGGYYAWGETEEKTSYSWSTYIHCDGTENTCHYIGSNICGSEYDVAHMKWGGKWQMPSKAQFNELRDNCICEQTFVNGIIGYKLTSIINNKSIFLPAAGNYIESRLNKTDDYVFTDNWSGTLSYYNYIGYSFIINENTPWICLDSERCYGLTVRPVWIGDSFSLKGDVNGDGTVSVTDVAMIVNHILGVNDSNFIIANADINADGVIDINDVMGTVSIILEGDNTPQVYLACPDENHPHLIDLGLPSGTLWACCNIGADKPEDYGGYYAWGETEEKSVYNDVTYQYATGNDDDGDGWYDDYHSDTGFSGVWQSLGDDIAGSQYDAAHVLWDVPWVMPSRNQIEELIENCTYEFTSLNGVEGAQFMGSNGGTIFLPAAGYRKNDGLSHAGAYGDYWASTPIPSNPDNAYSLYFNTGDVGCNDFYRANGRSVRPVSVESTFRPLAVSMSNVKINVGDTQTVEITSGNGSYTVSSSDTNVATASLSGTTITITGMAPGTAVVTVTDTATGSSQNVNVTVSDILNCPDDHHPHIIDLGLPSGTKWACCNVGADKPEAYGSHYAWGETEEKSTYSWSNYIHCEGSNSTCHNLGSDIAGTQYDAAHVKWGRAWKMPSYYQFDELVNNCTCVWTIINSIKGYKLTGQNGCTVFLPVAGLKIEENHAYTDTYSSGYYWSSTLLVSNPDEAYNLLFFDKHISSMSMSSRCFGESIRPVFDNKYDLRLSSTSVTLSVGYNVSVDVVSGLDNYTAVSSDPSIASTIINGNCVTIIAVSLGTTSITVTDTQSGQTATIQVTVNNADDIPQAYLTCPDDHHPHLIDLGLPSGTKWACCNVGADKPEAYGGYYSWGETSEKSYYAWSTYIHCDGSYSTCHNLGSDITGTSYDVAHMLWGVLWVMPSYEQIKELVKKCSYTWVKRNDIFGGLFTGPNGGKIFLPAAGFRWNYDLEEAGSQGCYWSSTLGTSLVNAYCLSFDSGTAYQFSTSPRGDRSHTVRPVSR